MPELEIKVKKISSKSAGSFWIIIEILFGSKVNVDEVRVKLDNARIINLFKINRQTLKRFEIESLNVIKFSFPRQIIQGDILDRDMHGAQLAVLLSEMDL